MPRRPEHKDLIDMTAMVDIVFFLLDLLPRHVDAIDRGRHQLARAAGARQRADSVQAVPDLVERFRPRCSCTIDDDDAIWVEDEEALSEQDLRSKLRAAHQKDDRTKMLIKCAPESTHGTFVSVLDAGADAGMTEIQFSVAHG